MRFEFKNLDAFKAKLNAKRLAYEPIKKAVTQSVADIRDEARLRAPRWRGDLQKSLLYENDGGWPIMIGEAGSDEPVAYFLEWGTGAFAEGDRPGKKSHHPGGEYLEEWAKDHGGFEKWGPHPGRAVAAVIGRRAGGKGGLEPRHYLRDAFDAMKPKIRQNFDQALIAIQRNWEA